MRWKRKAIPPINEDWAIGDLAQCVSEDWHLVYGAEAPRKGVKYVVLEVYPGYNVSDGLPSWGLRLNGLCAGNGRGFTADGFRKVLPDAYKEPCRTSTRRPVDA